MPNHTPAARICATKSQIADCLVSRARLHQKKLSEAAPAALLIIQEVERLLLESLDALGDREAPPARDCLRLPIERLVDLYQHRPT